MRKRFPRMNALLAALGLAAAAAAPSATAVQPPISVGVATAQSPAIGRAFRISAREHVLGQLDASQQMHISVALKLRNHQQLRSFIEAARQGLSPLARRHLSTAQFMQHYAPTSAHAQQVAHYLSRFGFHDVTISENRMLVSADGTASAVQAAFHTTLKKVRTSQGRIAFANTDAVHIPGALSASVLAVIGLQNVHVPHTYATVMAAGTQAITGHNPTDFSAIYGGTGVATASGVTVGIITQGSLSQTITDLNTFTSNNGLPTVTTQTINTNGTSTDTSGIGEWNLDSQDIVGAGGGQVGKLIFYNIPTLSNTNLTADINKIVSDNQAKIVNVSLGECETYAQQDGSAAAQDQAFQQAVAQGQTFSISTGDSGADECSNGGTTPSWPAASQYVIAVAGTTLDASSSTWNSETVWSGTGGSESTFEPKPSWQTLYSGSYRGVADVAFDADPSSGSLVIVNGASQQIGGTSLAAPIFSGLWARVIATKGTGVGFAGPLLYQLPASDFHDITSGNNGGETATTGYDLASGRGSLILANAINDLAGGTPTNNPPVAGFTDTVNGLGVSFTDTSTDSDGSIASRSWSFGDGSTATSANPTHSYAAAGTYTVTLTVTDNDGATDSHSAAVTVSSSGTGTALQNGVPVTVSGSQGTFSGTYTVAIPSGASNLVIAESGGSGDADLYVKFGSAPTTTSYDCRPYLSGNNESCSFASPQQGTYYIKLRGYQSYSNVSLKATWSTSSSGGGTGGLFDNPNNVTVPDLGTGTSSLSVSGQANPGPSNVQVHVKIVHSYRGDLRITLIAPNGGSVVLKQPDGSDSAANVDQTYGLDTSGINPNGTWKLQVDDVYAGDSGYIDDWSMQF